MSFAPKIFATLCYGLLWAGLFCLRSRKHRPLHPKLMMAGILGDLGLVVVLEVTRDAVNEALEGTMTLLQYGHIASSLMACLVYIPVIVFGVLLIKNPGSLWIREWHKRLALLAFSLRTVGFFLMFSMPTR